MTGQEVGVSWTPDKIEADALINKDFDFSDVDHCLGQILMPRGGLTLHKPRKRTSGADASKEDLQMLMPQRGLTDADASIEGFRC